MNSAGSIFSKIEFLSFSGVFVPLKALENHRADLWVRILEILQHPNVSVLDFDKGPPSTPVKHTGLREFF